jgi:hypothetical protein
MLSKISRYWWCQICGWGMVGLLNIFLAYTYQYITWKLIARILIALTLGTLITHLLRNLIIKKSWLVVSAEKIIFRLSSALIAALFVYSLSLVSLFEWFNLWEQHRWIGAPFVTRVIQMAFNHSILFIIWILAYYAYYLYQYSQKTKTIVR